MTCRTRFAPSPTGYLHIGGARTALYCWLEARHRGGEFVLRIEDTDRERSTQGAIDAILEAMEWLGLDYDEGPIYQTDRVARYLEVAEQLVADGKAYYAYETREELDAMREAAMARQEKPRYNGAARELGLPRRDDPNRVIRFKNPLEGTVVFDDLIKGRIEIANSELDDMVIFRTATPPTTSRWWWTTGTWASPRSSAATTTSTTPRARSTCTKASARRCRSSATCR